MTAALATTPVISMTRDHLPYISEILTNIDGVQHEVSFDIRDLNLKQLFATAIKFKKTILKHQDQLNDLILKMTIHCRPRALSVVGELLDRCRDCGMTVPVEVQVHDKNVHEEVNDSIDKEEHV